MEAKDQHREESKKYLASNIKTCLEELVKSLLKTKPEDPVSSPQPTLDSPFLDPCHD